MNLQALKNLQRKHWLMIIGGATLVFASGFTYLAAGSLHRLGEDPGVPSFLRRTGDEQSLFAQIAARQSAIAEQNAVAAKYEQRKAILDGMKADIAAARKRLPTEAQKAEVRQLIEDLARQVGSGENALVVKSVSIREAAPTTGRKAANDYQTIEYQTNVSADMDGIIQFINLVERNERFMTVEGIQLTTGGVSSASEAGGKVTGKPHSVQLRIITYIDSSGRQAGGKK